MAPPAGGAQFGVPAWTVQPAGTRFDPPIEVTLPNASSQPAGDNLPIVQWDHDLGQYVAMGRATVSEDGSVLITDSGSGITKAGWGGLCRYDPDKCGKNAPPKCKECESLFTGSGDCPTCYKDPAKDGLRDTSIDTNIFNVSYEPKFKELYKGSILNKLAKFGGAEIAFKGKIAGTLRESHICCSKQSGAISSNINIGGDLEFEFKWNWLKGSNLADQFTGIDELGAFTKIKVYGGTNGATSELIWDDCERKGSGTVTVGGGVTVSALDATIKGTAPINGADIKVEFTPLSFGGGGGFSAQGTAVLKNGIKELGNWSWYAFVKVGEYKFGDFKFSLINLNFTDKGAIDGVVLLGTQ